MYVVVRTAPNGSKGYKEFQTLEDATAWLNSEDVLEDKEYGFRFNLINSKEK